MAQQGLGTFDAPGDHVAVRWDAERFREGRGERVSGNACFGGEALEREVFAERRFDEVTDVTSRERFESGDIAGGAQTAHVLWCRSRCKVIIRTR